LGTGFHPEFPGRANVFMVGSLMGFSTAEIRAMLPGILEFSGLADFIDRPIKTYSSGMWVRLAFSVAISVDPALLLVDEALAVGDMLFQQKCISRLREFQKRGTAIVFVSHDLGAVKTLCSRAVLLESGRTVHEGSPEDVCSLYVSLMADKANREKLETRVRGVHRRYGNYRAEITGVRVENAKGELTEALISGETCAVEVEVRVTGQIEEPSVGFLIRDRLGNDIFGTNTSHSGVRISHDLKCFTVRFAFEMDLGPGNYYVSAAVHSGRDHLEDCYDWIDNAAAFTVLPTEPVFAGCARLKPRVSVSPLGTLASPQDCCALDAG
jgi:lipopolysaccharide transport system ATP-binding protein